METLDNRGLFEEIDDNYNKEISKIFLLIDDLIDSKNTDFDTLINEYRDSLTARELGFNKINKQKHGFDACSTEGIHSGKYLESKQSSTNSKTHSAVFNDTTLEKAESFKSENTVLSLTISNKFSNIGFTIFGSNPEIGHYLEKRVEEQTKKGIRRTQNISFSTLIKKYNFKIKLHTTSKEEFIDYIFNKFPKTFNKDNLIKSILDN